MSIRVSRSQTNGLGYIMVPANREPYLLAMSNAGASWRRLGGAERDRTADLLIANEALSQLSYSPKPLAWHPREYRGPGVCRKPPQRVSRRAPRCAYFPV